MLISTTCGARFSRHTSRWPNSRPGHVTPFLLPERFARSTTEEVMKLASMDLSCISDPMAAETYAAQILEAFARNAKIYTELHGKLDSEETIKIRLAEAVSAGVFGQNLLTDAKKREDVAELAASKSDAAGKSQSFLRRVETGEIAATQEKLLATIRGLKKAQQDLQ